MNQHPAQVTVMPVPGCVTTCASRFNALAFAHAMHHQQPWQASGPAPLIQPDRWAALAWDTLNLIRGGTIPFSQVVLPRLAYVPLVAAPVILFRDEWELEVMQRWGRERVDHWTLVAFDAGVQKDDDDGD